MKQKSSLREIIETLVIAVIIALFIRTFIVQSFKIPSASMRPTLMEGDKILVNKFIYGAKIPFTSIRLPSLREPEVGDIVVFVYPSDPKRDFIKRFIGKAGDEIEIIEGDVYLNGDKVTAEPIAGFEYTNMGLLAEGSVTVPPENYFVLGDNSPRSSDSRDWGFVPEDNLIGRAFFIFWPPHRMGTLK